MSDIKMVDSKRIHGRIERLDMSSGQSQSTIDATVTINHDEIWTDCIFCKLESYTGYRFLDEGICKECRDKMIKRLQLIINFE